MTDDLVAWLRAQLDDDERVGRAAWPGPWKASGPRKDGAWSVEGPPSDLRTGALAVPSKVPAAVASDSDRPDAEHIARHDPARVLAEVDAKRRVLDHCESYAEDGCTSGADLALTILPLLALPYADRPGYRDEWKP